MQSLRGSLAARISFKLLLLVTTVASVAATGSAQAAPPPANAVRVSNALMVLPVNHVARVALSQAAPSGIRLPMQVRFKDANGTVLGTATGVLATNQPVIAAVQRGTVVTPSPMLVQAEVLVGPIPTGLGLTTCPVHFSMQVTAADGNGPGEFCTIDPCLNVSPGAPKGSRTFPLCPGTPVNLQQ